MEKKHRQPQLLSGVVVSDKMDKTRVVMVQRKIQHSFYGKRILKKSKFLIHDEKNESKIGDRVIAASTRPLSKNKSFRLVQIVEGAGS